MGYLKRPIKKASKDRYKVWYRQAEYDYQAGIISLNEGYNEWAAYQASQAVEKGLKSVIARAGWHPPRVHKISILLGMCNSINPECKNTKFNFKHLESFTFIARYPFLIPGKNETPHELISEHEAKKALEQSREILDSIKNLLKVGVEGLIYEVAIEETYDKNQIERRLDEVSNILIKEFSPEKIILFGGFARELPKKKHGTMDILIIADSNDRFIDRIKKARTATGGGAPIIEPLIYTPEEFDYMLNEEGEGFLESAVQEGIVIFEK